MQLLTALLQILGDFMHGWDPTCPVLASAAAMHVACDVARVLAIVQGVLHAIAWYYQAILVDGDWANDWLTHVPRALRPTLQAIGRMLATLLGR